jgi:hypothetical protein
MNTLNTQGLTFGKLTFSDEDDLFDLHSFDKNPEELFPKESEQPSSPAYELNCTSNKPNGVSQFTSTQSKPSRSKENFKLGDELYFDSLRAEDDFEVDASSFNFHFEHLSREMEDSESVHSSDDNSNIILKIDSSVEEASKGANEDSINSLANGTTTHSNFMSPKNFVKNVRNQVTPSAVAHKICLAKEAALKDSLCQSEVQTVAPSERTSKTKDTNEDIDLSQRRDVVNKTVLRVLRRFYNNKFRDMFAKKFKGKESKSKWYFEYIRKFVTEIFGNRSDLGLLQSYMASIINPKHMTALNIKETGLERDQFMAFHDTLYKYSHTRLVSLFKVEPLAVLYNYFYDCPQDDLMKSEASVNKNPTLYYQAFADFKKVFEGLADAKSLTIN